MSPVRFVYVGLVLALGLLLFGLGSYRAEMANALQIARSQAQIDALRAQLRRRLSEPIPAESLGTTGTDRRPDEIEPVDAAGRESLVDEVKRQLQSEMGLLPLRLLRERRASFVELYASDNFGKTSYGTAGYLGDGMFITVKHGVVAIGDDEGDQPDSRTITSVKVQYDGRTHPAQIVDAGDARVEVHSGDWAIIHVDDPVNLPPLSVDTLFPYEFASPVFRLGNDYSKGVILSTGYVGQRTSNGLVTCLTDGHPGVSGGGVLDQQGSLVGIPIGRMQGDFRFSFILPVRAEMFRRVPRVRQARDAHDGS